MAAGRAARCGGGFGLSVHNTRLEEA